MKPYSQACENNKDPILNELAPRLSVCKSVLEIGSGTGQHAVYFSSKMPSLNWHTSDRLENHSGIIEWIDESHLTNVVSPINLHVLNDEWPTEKFDAVFTANTCHIMCWEEVVAMFKGVKNTLGTNGLFVIYGPFNYQGHYTSESNKNFDAVLRSRDPASGIRNFEEVLLLANKNNLDFIDDITMPANNRLLFFKTIN